MVYRGPYLWYNLPPVIRVAASIKLFKARLKTYLDSLPFETYVCQMMLVSGMIPTAWMTCVGVCLIMIMCLFLIVSTRVCSCLSVLSLNKQQSTFPVFQHFYLLIHYSVCSSVLRRLRLGGFACMYVCQLWHPLCVPPQAFFLAN